MKKSLAYFFLIPLLGIAAVGGVFLSCKNTKPAEIEIVDTMEVFLNLEDFNTLIDWANKGVEAYNSSSTSDAPPLSPFSEDFFEKHRRTFIMGVTVIGNDTLFVIVDELRK